MRRGGYLQHPAISAPEQLYPLAERADVTQHVSAISEQLLTDGGQHKPASHTIKKLEAKLLLQVADLPLTPHMQIATTSFDFAPALSAVIDADYHPGSPLLWAGFVLAALAALAARFFPMRRVLVRHHGHWTEVFASGRGVRADTQALLTPDPPL